MSHPSDSNSSDLNVDILSDALKGRVIDFIISGSIGAMESPRLIRALRRLGAEVRPWLTKGGSEFTTVTALEWASAQKVRLEFSGTDSHIATGDACVIAPASTQMLAKLAWGDTNTPASALATSYLGMKKPVLVLPAMHDSLWKAPSTQRNIDVMKTLEPWVRFLRSRTEEGKQKMPEPAFFANQVAHILNENKKPVLVTMGGTRGYIDSVRFVANYSTGALGSMISEELYRQGFETQVVCGPCPIRPLIADSIYNVETNDAMTKQIAKLSYVAAVCAASVLDYIPSTQQGGKIKSDKAELVVQMKKTEKIIAKILPKHPVKVGFKLEVGLDEKKGGEIFADYAKRYDLSCFVLNDLKNVDSQKHRADVFSKNSPKVTLSSKKDIAIYIAQHVQSQLEKSHA